MHIDDLYPSQPQPQSKPATQDYYFDNNGNVIFTSKYLVSRGYCCGNGCRHCPYKPKHQKGNRKM